VSSAPRLIDLPLFSDDRGTLGFVEEGGLVPFPLRRLFYLLDVPPGGTRGHHAHRVQHQLLIMLAGGCRLTTDDGEETLDWVLHGPRQALHVPPLIWLELADFTSGAVCAVLASDRFDEADYIRDRTAFARATGGTR